MEATDVREGGAWSPGQQVKNDVIYVVAVAALRIVSSLPRRLLRVLGRALGFLVWLVAPSLRRVALHNVARVLPEVASSDRSTFVRLVFRSLGTLLGDVAFTLDPRRPIEPLPFLPGSRECLAEAIAEGRGVVFASAHLGPWERVAASMVAAGVPLTVVAREPYDPRFTRVYERLREARGVRTVYRGRPGAAMSLVRVLRSGSVLGIPMDLASRVPSIPVPFLGHVAPTAIGPARLAVRTGAAVVVGTAAPAEDGSLGIAVTRIQRSACERELTERINDEIGTRVRALPEMWPWMHPRWGNDLKQG